ncbi:hypothetical protein JCM11641_007426 [Rhodosporidiobolus odoratus]
METYASASLDATNWFSYGTSPSYLASSVLTPSPPTFLLALSLEGPQLTPWYSLANKHVFPELCNAAGWTDVDAYCLNGTSDLCCGLCINTSVAGLGQFVWAIGSYGAAAFAYTLSPGATWGLAIMQVVNANAFITVGIIRVVGGAIDGGMTRWHTQFLWPQALGFIFIMAPAIFAPQWSRLGLTYNEMHDNFLARQAAGHPEPTRNDAREEEERKMQEKHGFWSYPIFGVWFLNMAAWTGLYIWVCLTPLEFSQSNCEGKLDYSLSPTAATIILGIIAYALLALDALVYYKKMGASDLIIDRFMKLRDGKVRSFKEHRRLERKITIGVTAAMFFIWLMINCWLYVEGQYKFLLSGADGFTFGQVEQLTALFPDVLGLIVAINAYYTSRTNIIASRHRHRNGNGGSSLRAGSALEIRGEGLLPRSREEEEGNESEGEWPLPSKSGKVRRRRSRSSLRTPKTSYHPTSETDDAEPSTGRRSLLTRSPPLDPSLPSRQSHKNHLGITFPSERKDYSWSDDSEEEERFDSGRKRGRAARPHDTRVPTSTTSPASIYPRHALSYSQPRPQNSPYTASVHPHPDVQSYAPGPSSGIGHALGYPVHPAPPLPSSASSSSRQPQPRSLGKPRRQSLSSPQQRSSAIAPDSTATAERSLSRRRSSRARRVSYGYGNKKGRSGGVGVGRESEGREGRVTEEEGGRS